MPFRRSLSLLVCAATVVTLGFVVLHTVTPPAPGGSFSWMPAAPTAPEQRPANPQAPGAVPSAPPRPAPSADQGLLGGLTMPLTTLFQHLNDDTRSSARGEYTILQALEKGLRDRIEQFLNWVAGRR